MSLSNLLTTLKLRSGVQSSDGIADATLEYFLNTSLAQHNPAYTFDTLPAREEELVILLAWIMVCETSASTSVNESNLKSSSSGLAGGYGQDRNTPFHKNLDFIKYLKQRYADLSRSILNSDTGLSATEGQVVMGTLYRTNDEIDALTPLRTSPVPPIALSNATPLNTSVVLKWSFPPFENYYSVVLFKSSTPNIREEWNHDSVSDIPEISSSSERLVDIKDPTQRAVKVINLSPSTQYYFLAVLKTNSGRFAYSSEVSVTTPA